MTAPGLYVHVPFCRSRCVYCVFCSTTREGEVDRWLAALAREADAAAGQWERFETLYIGGGTPSCLSPGQRETLFRTLHDTFRFAPDAEITLEANPADLDRPAVEQLAGSGVNRVSLGVQSFDNGVLEFLGRRHRVEDVERSVDALRAGGIERVSLDLISAIPGQSDDQWLDSLRRTVALDPQHISCYQLTVEEGTPLALSVERGEVTPVDEDAAAAQFLAGSSFIQGAGFEHYEVSNYARGRENRARHNMKYWTHVPYLGLGPSAHSFDGAFRWWNDASFDDHCRRLEEGQCAENGREQLTPGQLEMERVALGLRLADGFQQGSLANNPATVARLEHFRALGLLTLDQGLVIPTRQGMLVADGLARELCPFP